MENNVVILMGIANLVSDGISMGLGDYLSAKSEQSYIKSEFEREKWEMEQNPQGEAGILSPSLLIHLLKVEGGAAE